MHNGAVVKYEERKLTAAHIDTVSTKEKGAEITAPCVLEDQTSISSYSFVP